MGKTSIKMRKTAMNEKIYIINQKGTSKELIRLHICGTTFPDKGYRIVRPKSPVACIEYVEEGSGTVDVGGEIFTAKAGDSYFLQVGKDQFYHSNADSPWKKHFINVSGRLLESMTEGYGLENISHFEGLDLKEELLRIVEIGRSDEDRTGEIILILNEIFTKMYGHVKSRTESSNIVAEMKDFLNTQVMEKFRIEALCRHISRSESQTIRIFKKNFGITPYMYVLNKKIGLAKVLLTDTNLSIRQIAEKLCFADEYYFSNIFKDKVGVTPSAFRKGVGKTDKR